MPTSGSAVGEHEITPPDLPTDYIYTRCYCEENVYLLCQEFLGRKEVCERWEVWVVFISNENKTVALWEQKAVRQEGAPVVWDYHAILVLKAKGSSGATSQGEAEKIRNGDGLEMGTSAKVVGNWVYDFDTSIIPIPCRWDEYVTRTFPFELLPQYRSLFRLVPGQIFIDNFASDRSHMLQSNAEEGQPLAYIHPPPVYNPICGELSRRASITNNLMTSFVYMERAAGNTYGDVWSLEEVTMQLAA